LAERQKAANVRAVQEFRQHMRRAQFTVSPSQADCAMRNIFYSVNLHVEGPRVERVSGITQYISGAWFTTDMPSAEITGGLEVPNGTAHLNGFSQWVVGCSRAQYVVTYDSRRFPNGPVVKFTWNASYRDQRCRRPGSELDVCEERGSFEVQVRPGAHHRFRGN
jgi:hypothetical protein